jgi:hypothetical protein
MDRILFITDLYYVARGRTYYSEDLYLTEQLRRHFALSLCHPLDVLRFEESADILLIRNAGPLKNFADRFNVLRQQAADGKIKMYNPHTAKGDMNGKDYLIQLTDENFPVIPTVEDSALVDKLPQVERYVIKPKDGADSIGFEILNKRALLSERKPKPGSMLIQPYIEFEYEVSFYFIDREFQYAMYAPNKTERWKLTKYQTTSEDVEFARRFIEWNSLPYGIQRVDACRTATGQLLLVELEDLNPYLSLLDLDASTRDIFVSALVQSLEHALTLDLSAV